MSDIEKLDLASENQRLRARVAELEAEVPYVTDLRAANGQLDMTIQGAKSTLSAMATALAKNFEADGGINYVQYEVRSGDKDFVLTLQRAAGKTPHQLRQEAEARAAKAEARVAELEAHIRKGDEFIGAVERAEKAESERDAARAEIRRLKSTGDGNEANRAWYEFGVKDGTEFTLVERDTARVERNAAQNNLKLMAEGHDIEMAEMRTERDAALAQVAELETEKAHILQGLAESTKKRLDVLAQVAVLREALTAVRGFCVNKMHAPWLREVHAAIDAAIASAPAPTRAEAEAWLRAGEPVRGALAVPAEPDYSGLCAAPSCEGHCGYVHARGCEAVREYLADHGGEPYRAPSKEATRG